MRFVALAAAWAVLGCESSDGGGAPVVATSPASGSAKSRPGFSDDIARQITGETPPAAGSDAAGSDAAGSSAAGSSAAGSSAKSPATAGSAAPGSAVAGSAGSAAAGSATKPIPAAGSATKPAAGSAVAEAPKPAPPGSAAPPAAKLRGATAALKLPPQSPAELAKIKLQLGPNWQRDTEGPGTISYTLNEPALGQPVMFVFEYGYELESAPVDREAYKKWLVDNKILTNLLDRQRGVSWYIEGTDGGGKPAFRYVAQFGPKKLICGGSLYRDAELNRFKDHRNEIVSRGKQICETVAL